MLSLAKYLQTLVRPRLPDRGRTAPRRSGPDFICIGMQKAGTRWLYQQLRGHPEFWMPPIKELNFFNGNLEKTGNLRRIDTMSLKIANRLSRNRAHPNDAMDAAFFRSVKNYYDNYLNFDWYESLLNLKGDLLTGDITEAYSMLPDRSIRDIRTRFPDVRIILLLRDPVERLWSQLCMEWRSGRIATDELNDWELLRPILGHAEFVGRMYPTQVWNKWAVSFDQDHMRYWFLEDISERPYETIVSILDFLGASNRAGATDPKINTKATNQKMPLPDDMRRQLAGLLSSELEACAELFGGHAIAWRNKYM